MQQSSKEMAAEHETIFLEESRNFKDTASPENRSVLEVEAMAELDAIDNEIAVMKIRRGKAKLRLIQVQAEIRGNNKKSNL
ncbi:hypothetical protein PG993_007399 [Apiospora rasikravindrae]|uniref:Uncharacterized protein n=1 Tax=Apiospora rasikravindrae TaxID=990691 RepID=A0ABR1SZM5_9PEZI